MKRYDNTFLALLGDCAPDSKPLPEQEVQMLCHMAAIRGGPPVSTRRRSFRPLLIAAVLGASLLAVAAAYYNVSDAFRGVLQEQNAAGDPVALSELAPVVDQSGILVGKTATDQGLDVTVRGVIGDESSFQILMDIVDRTGAPLAIEQADGTLSRDLLRFGGIKMRTEDTLDEPDTGSSFDYSFTDMGYISGSDRSISTSPAGDRVTMLIDVNVEQAESLVGKTLYLTLRDLMQIAVLDGTGVGMEPGDLQNLIAQFSPLSQGDLQAGGYAQDLKTGKTEYRYELITDGGKSLPLASGLPGYALTNAGVRDGVVYLRGTAPSVKPGESLFTNPQLRNPHTGETLPFLMGGETEEDKGKTTWTLSFEGAASAEALRDYTLVLDAGEGLHPLREGQWKFEIPLRYENTTRRFRPDRKFSVGGFSMKATELTISPYHVSMKASVGAAAFEAMMYREHPVAVDWHPIVSGPTAWDQVDETAVLTMKDGSQVLLPMGGGGGGSQVHLPTGESSGDVEDFSIGFDLQVVIDPGQVERFAFGDLVYTLSE